MCESMRTAPQSGPRRHLATLGIAAIAVLVASWLPAPTSLAHSSSYKISFSQTYSDPSYPQCVNSFKVKVAGLSPQEFGLGGPFTANGPDKDEETTLEVKILDASGSQVLTGTVTLKTSQTTTTLGTVDRVEYKAEVQLDASTSWSISITAVCPCSGKFPC